MLKNYSNKGNKYNCTQLQITGTRQKKMEHIGKDIYEADEAERDFIISRCEIAIIYIYIYLRLGEWLAVCAGLYVRR